MNFDTETGRRIVIGKQGNKLMMVPYEEDATILPLSPFTPPVANKSNLESIPGDLSMNSPKMQYFPDQDVIHIAISEGEEFESLELSPNITAELNAEGELIGVEILKASLFLRDSILETTQAKPLQLQHNRHAA